MSGLYLGSRGRLAGRHRKRIGLHSNGPPRCCCTPCRWSSSCPPSTNFARCRRRGRSPRRTCRTASRVRRWNRRWYCLRSAISRAPPECRRGSSWDRLDRCPFPRKTFAGQRYPLYGNCPDPPRMYGTSSIGTGMCSLRSVFRRRSGSGCYGSRRQISAPRRRYRPVCERIPLAESSGSFP